MCLIHVDPPLSKLVYVCVFLCILQAQQGTQGLSEDQLSQLKTMLSNFKGGQEGPGQDQNNWTQWNQMQMMAGFPPQGMGPGGPPGGPPMPPMGPGGPMGPPPGMMPPMGGPPPFGPPGMMGPMGGPPPFGAGGEKQFINVLINMY